MAYTTIDDPTIYFNTILYTGDGSTSNAITGVGFQPDWVWIKRRNNGNPHLLNDIVRGATKDLRSDNADQETTNNQYGILKSFDSDGFTVSVGSTNGARANTSGGTFVAWNWKAGGTASSNSDGTITTSISANTTAGFSIIKYAGNSTNSTIGHGLGASPEYIIFKEIDGAESWRVHSIHTPNNSSNTLALNLSSAAFSQTNWISAISSSTISIGTDSSFNTSGNNYIAYAFAPKKGYSKFGSYTGNGNADGTFVYTGMSPSFVLLKETSNANNWMIFDNKRSPFNLMDDFISPDISDAESTGNSNNRMDMLSNGFKIRGSGSATNRSGSNFIYMAFAQSPFTNSNGVPNNAR